MAVALSAVGCSSTAYDSDHAVQVAAYRTAAEFSPLHAAGAPMAAGRVLVRVPRLFRDEVSRDVIDNPRPEEPVPVERQRQFNRAKPPFVRAFPGFEKAYEMQASVAGGTLPVVLTVGAVAKDDRSRDDVEASILEQVKAHRPFASAAWQKGREVTDIVGVKRKWDVLSLRGPQPFDGIPGGTDETPASIDGICQIWVSADPDQEFCTVLAWRLAVQSDPVVKVDELAPLVARAVQAAPVQPAAARQ